MPAAQTVTPEAKLQIRTILQILHKLNQLILPQCLKKFEYDITSFNAEDNNIFSFGGLSPGATGCQANMSSSVDDLSAAIGSHQGSLHTDINDCWCRWTVFHLLLHLPRGKYIMHL
jgi:hypothetical protein